MLSTETDHKVVGNILCSPLKIEKSVKRTPKSVKLKKVKRKDVKLLSPKSPILNISNKRQKKVTEKQRHLVSTIKDEPSVVSKLINIFERKPQSMNCLESNSELLKKSDTNCIKEGSVKNAFELLMLQNGTDCKARTPKGKSIKRLDQRKTTSSQKKISTWVKK